jgi:hypothetical protein
MIVEGAFRMTMQEEEKKRKYSMTKTIGEKAGKWRPFPEAKLLNFILPPIGGYGVGLFTILLNN